MGVGNRAYLRYARQETSMFVPYRPEPYSDFTEADSAAAYRAAVESVRVPFMKGQPSIAEISEGILAAGVEERKQELEAERKSLAGLSDDDILASVRTGLWGSFEELWANQLEGTVEGDQMLAAFGSPEAAIAAIAADWEDRALADQTIDVDAIRDDRDEMFENAVNALTPEDFKFGQRALNLMAAYAKNGPMKWATMGVLAMANDDEARSLRRIFGHSCKSRFDVRVGKNFWRIFI